jgi:hypothetical protein
MNKININKIEWKAFEYIHKEHSPDWYWALGLIVLITCVILVWIGSYLFAIFIVIGGATLSLFNIRHPEEITYSIETSGFSMGKDKYEWKNIRGFDIKKGEDMSKLLVETDKYFLPIYTIPLPNNLVGETKESLLKIIPEKELSESQPVLFMEKLGF